MEATKEKLTRNRVRAATRQEIRDLNWENGELKQLVADLSLEVYRLKKRPSRCHTTSPVPADERLGEGRGTDQGSLVSASQVKGPQRAVHSQGPTIGGSDEGRSNDLRIMQEAVRFHGTVLLSRKFTTFCRQPGIFQS